MGEYQPKKKEILILKTRKNRKISIQYSMRSCFRLTTWSKNVSYEKNEKKKISFCLPSENLVQILPESESGSSLDTDPHSS
jgi:hypothetical protein